jgi:hypothetical protein
MKRMLAVLALIGALAAGALAAGPAVAKKKHHKGTKVSMKGWYVSFNNHTSTTVKPGGTVKSCVSAGHKVFFLGLIFNWKNAKAGKAYSQSFTGPGLQHATFGYTWPSAKGSYPGHPSGVNEHATRSDSFSGTYTGSIIQKGKTLGHETIKVVVGC